MLSLPMRHLPRPRGLAKDSRLRGNDGRNEEPAAICDRKTWQESNLI
jgi:hypothetical protein